MRLLRLVIAVLLAVTTLAGCNQQEAATPRIIQELKSGYGGGNNHFGLAILLLDDVLAIGAPGEDSGKVYLYPRGDPTWGTPQVLQPPAHQEHMFFGAALAFANGTFIVGAPGYEAETTGGAAFLYRQDHRYTFESMMLPENPAPGQEFGRNILAAPNWLFVAATGSLQGGSIDAFNRDNDANWVHSQTVVSNNLTRGAEFGWSMSKSGGLLAVGAFNASYEGCHSCGEVYVFGLAHGLWKRIFTYRSPQPQADSGYGYQVALERRPSLLENRAHRLTDLRCRAPSTSMR